MNDIVTTVTDNSEKVTPEMGNEQETITDKLTIKNKNFDSTYTLTMVNYTMDDSIYSTDISFRGKIIKYFKKDDYILIMDLRDCMEAIPSTLSKKSFIINEKEFEISLSNNGILYIIPKTSDIKPGTMIQFNVQLSL